MENLKEKDSFQNIALVSYHHPPAKIKIEIFPEL